MKQNYPPKPNTFMQAKAHTSNKLAQTLWVARFYPVWMCDCARALTQDTGSYLAQFRAVQWFLKPYVTWVDETLDWLEECRQKEREDQGRQHSSLRASHMEGHIPSAQPSPKAGGGSDAATSNPDPLMTGLEDYFAACDQASAKCPKKFPPIPEKQRQRMRQITAEFLLHVGCRR
ncbi:MULTISPECIES: hypothetical protein [Acetobacter]|uniref:Uncharacterized protein n=2 Tax=Acetobacter TaxID=434 RepID=A0AAN1PJJ4_9PROT|nr:MULTISPECIES: hypothetical protein [Acetobacter]ASL39490.1 hypothetical protein CBI36_02840 [Acetobacter oryzifermentans]ASL41519.1 hypothetical protein CBI36_14770 [Acetobacter oryzifermentans]AXC25895.1 hypothetical protein DS739_03250 [Acetobacter sp. JWB]AXC27586.1 hypothetical protein DS739_13110 [Acetobacter sp. JWB]AXM99159.1 hypothetical protein CJF59_00165 [Acetobacter pomorum]